MAAIGTHRQITEALQILAPEKLWSLSGDEYTGLTWQDAGDPPTEQEIIDQVALL